MWSWIIYSRPVSTLMSLSWGGCVAQRKHSCLPPSSPRFESRLYQDFFSLLLGLWTELRLNPSSAKQWISQMLWRPELSTTKKLMSLYNLTNHQIKARDWTSLWNLQIFGPSFVSSFDFQSSILIQFSGMNPKFDFEWIELKTKLQSRMLLQLLQLTWKTSFKCGIKFS